MLDCISQNCNVEKSDIENVVRDILNSLNVTALLLKTLTPRRKKHLFEV